MLKLIKSQHTVQALNMILSFRCGSPVEGRFNFLKAETINM
jgi:hypothetical protein